MKFSGAIKYYWKPLNRKAPICLVNKVRASVNIKENSIVGIAHALVQLASPKNIEKELNV